MGFAMNLLLKCLILLSVTGAVPLTFFDLEEKTVTSGELISIKGFLYESEDGYILAAQPNLKSCCVGKVEHIFVSGDSSLKASPYVITLEGMLKVDPSHKYVLEQAHVVPEEKYTFLWLVVGVTGILLGFFYRVRGKIKRKVAKTQRRTIFTTEHTEKH